MERLSQCAAKGEGSRVNRAGHGLCGPVWCAHVLVYQYPAHFTPCCLLPCSPCVSLSMSASDTHKAGPSKHRHLRHTR